jgi:hypothetical protein
MRQDIYAGYGTKFGMVHSQWGLQTQNQIPVVLKVVKEPRSLEEQNLSLVDT